MPHLRNPNFTGRDDLLAALRTALASGQPAALTQAQAVYGLGGVGKSQIAVEYAYRNQDAYQTVWWIEAETPSQQAAGYVALACAAGLAQPNQTDQAAIVHAVRAWLGRTGGWLLIFDNARCPDDLADYLPQGSAGHVLITSRNPAWDEVAHALHVAIWPRDESVEYLRKRTGQDDPLATDALAAELGDLPLALAQAAGYVAHSVM